MMDAKSSATSENVYQEIFFGLPEVSLEEQFEMKRTAKQCASEFLVQLRHKFAGSDATLVDVAQRTIIELANSEATILERRNLASSDLGTLSRYHTAAAGRARYPLLDEAYPIESECLRPGSEGLPVGCVFPCNDLSVEERYSDRYMLSQRIAVRKSIDSSALLRCSMTDLQTNLTVRDELGKLIVQLTGQELQPNTSLLRSAEPKPDQNMVNVSAARNQSLTTAATETSRTEPRENMSLFGKTVEMDASTNSSVNVSRNCLKPRSASKLESSGSSRNTGASKSTHSASGDSSKPGFMRPTFASRMSTTQSQSHASTRSHAISRSANSNVSNKSLPSTATSDKGKRSAAHSRSAVASVSSKSAQNTSAHADVSANKSNYEPLLGESLTQSRADSKISLGPSLCDTSSVLTHVSHVAADGDREQELRSMQRSRDASMVQQQQDSFVLFSNIEKSGCSASMHKSNASIVLGMSGRENAAPKTSLGTNSFASVGQSDSMVNRSARAAASVLGSGSANATGTGSANATGSGSGSASTEWFPAVSNLASDCATPQRGALQDGEFGAARRFANPYDSVIETPNRQMSVSSFLPPLSSTIIHGVLYEDDEFVSAVATPGNSTLCTPTSAANFDAATQGNIVGCLTPRSLATPQRVATDNAGAADEADMGAASNGVNPVADGCVMYVDNLKDDEEEDANDAMGVGAPPVRRGNLLRKPRRSSTTFQRRPIVEMSPIAEINSSNSSSSGSASATTSHSASNCASANASRSRSSAISSSGTPDQLGENSHFANLSAFDYIRQLFPKAAVVLDVNANKMETLSRSQADFSAGVVWQENPCSAEAQLANLEQSGFLRGILDGHLDIVSMQTDLEMPETLVQLLHEASGEPLQKRTVNNAYSALNVSQARVTREGTFKLGSLTYDRASCISTGAFANYFRMHRLMDNDCNNSNSDVLAKLLLPAKSDSVSSHGEICEVERLRIEAFWETYMHDELQKRRAELAELRPQEDSAHRFLASFVQLHHTVLLRDSAALLFNLPSGAAVTLATLLDCSRLLRAADSVRGSTLPFNEALAHLCTVELCEIVRSLVLIGIIHADLRAENLMVTRLTFDSKCCDSFRSGEPLLKLIGFGSAIDMKLYGADSKFDSGASGDTMKCRTGASLATCPAVRDKCGWSYDMDLYCVARIVQTLIQSSNELQDLEKRNGEWRESVPLKRRWNVPMWEDFFRNALCHEQMATREGTLSKLDSLINTLWTSFEQRPAEKASSIANDLKCLREQL